MTAIEILWTNYKKTIGTQGMLYENIHQFNENPMVQMTLICMEQYKDECIYELKKEKDSDNTFGK